MLRKLLLSMLFFATTANAQYFYYWADDYEATVSADGSVYINTHLKSSDDNTYTFRVNEKIIADDVETFANEVVDFPIIVSKKYTENRDRIVVCSSKKSVSVEFSQEVCLSIKLYN